MTSHTATAQREGRWWVVHVDGLGTTQGRNLTEAREMAADLVATVLDTDIEHVDVDVNFVIPDVVSVQVDTARHEYEQADELQRDAAKRMRGAITDLKHAGLPGKDIAALLHISPQRVSQLANH